MRVTERDSGWLFSQSLIESRVFLLGYGTDVPDSHFKSEFLVHCPQLFVIYSPHPDWRLIIQPNPLGFCDSLLLLIFIVGCRRGSRVGEEVDWEDSRVLGMFLSAGRSTTVREADARKALRS